MGKAARRITIRTSGSISAYNLLKQPDAAIRIYEIAQGPCDARRRNRTCGASLASIQVGQADQPVNIAGTKA